MLFNLVPFECVQVFTLSSLLLQSVSVCCPRSFRIPCPSPRSMFDLGATQEILHQMCIHLS